MPNQFNQFIILLSSNQDAPKNMEAAKELLIKIFPEILFSESIESDAVVYEKEKEYSLAPKPYLNAVAVGRTLIKIEEMQIFLKQSEIALGRTRGPLSHGLVAIDLDLVEWNKEVLRPKDAEQSYYKKCMKKINNK
jgi:2-amino-4-hydroxy-6-hydroxymethyldihydropteridine diphosphokinase